MAPWLRRPNQDTLPDDLSVCDPDPYPADGGSDHAWLPISGDLPCSRAGCSRVNAVVCAYVDRRGSTCDTAWCPDDQLIADGRPYCARHGRVVRALHTEGLGPDPLPDIDNRAASLVDFVADAVSTSMGTALHAAWPGDLGLGVQPLAVQHSAPHRRRVWTRKWKLHSHTGNAVAVMLAVAEDQDHVLMVTVDSRTVAELVPPWISHRATGAKAAVRQAFYDDVVEAARRRVEQAHQQSTAAMLRDVRPDAPDPSPAG